MINHLRFCKYFCDKYHNKYYPDISDDIIADIVDTVLNLAPGVYFTYEMVQEFPEFCKQCGMCCVTVDCAYFNGRTCDEYATRFDACTEFPWYEINGETGLILDPNCQFAINLAEMMLDKEFRKLTDLFEEENNDT